MPVLGRRRLNGVPMGTIAATGNAPSAVTSLAVGSSSSTTISVTYGMASGTPPLAYSGWTSPHGLNSWSRNGGAFDSGSGTFIGLSSSATYDLRIVASNNFGLSTTDLLNGVTTQAAATQSFTVMLNKTSGSAGVAVTMVVSPSAGAWPSGQIVIPSVTGLAGSFDNSSLVGNGSTPLYFIFIPASASGTSGTLSATASGLINASGSQPYRIDAATTASPSNRFELSTNLSVVAPGSPVQVTISPNGSFPSGTIALTGTNGSFSPSPTITLDRNSTSPVTVVYTPATTGEHNVTATNTAGLYNPYPAPVSVFANSGGNLCSLKASLTRADMTTYQRDSANGNPSGFSLSWAKGWGEVWLTLNSISGATSGLWIRLYDATSSGASSTVSSGVALHASPVQVYGAVSSPGTIRVLLPAGPYIYYADIATDAAFSNPVRIAQRFRVGVVIAHFSRSQESGLSRAYAYSGSVPLPTTYRKTATWVGFDYRYADTDSGWFVHDGVSSDPYQYHYGEASSSGAQEIGRLMESQLGVCVGIAGNSATGGGLDSMVNHDGSLTGGFTGTVAAAIGAKFRYFWMATGGWDGVDNNYPNETQGENRIRFNAAVNWIAKSYPACAVIGWVAGASGMFGSDGSRSVGFTRNQMILLNEIEATNPMVVSKECYSWNEYYGNHATMAARVQYVRAGFRLLMAAELASAGGFQTINRGPRLSSTGTIKAGTRTISIPYTLPNGVTLQAAGINCTNPNFTTGSATNNELASLFAVYLSGGYSGSGTAVRIDNVVLNLNASTIDINLSGNSGITFADGSTASMPAGFTVHYAADFTVSNNAVPLGSGRAVMITDDRIDNANGIPHGWHMRPALDIAISTV